MVFEAGIAATSLSWQLVQPEIAKFTQTASYDRGRHGNASRTRRAAHLIYLLVGGLHQAAQQRRVRFPSCGVAEIRQQLLYRGARCNLTEVLPAYSIRDRK